MGAPRNDGPEFEILLSLARDAANEILPTMDALHQFDRSPNGLTADGTPPGVAPRSPVRTAHSSFDRLES